MNACNGLTINTDGETIFLSTADGGSDIDGALAISIYNSGSADALIKANGHHTTVATKPDGTSAAGVSQYLLVPAGKSVTLEVENNAGAYGQIGSVFAKSASATTTLSFGVTKRR